jgi:predicted phage terminase large subunit-like protein
MHDLCGYLIEKSNNWTVLNIPAISAEQQQFQVSGLNYNSLEILRAANTALLPKAASYESLMRIKSEIGIYNFSSQYLQNPLPEDGAIFKPEWFIEFETLPTKIPTAIIQSWDTALKDGEENDYSACVTINVYDYYDVATQQATHHFYITNIYRAKLNFPDLKSKAIELINLHKPSHTIIEDKGSGTSLIQTLIKEGLINIIANTPKGSKKERFTGTTGYYADERVRFLKDATWLESIKKEILTFPSGRNDDMVDAITQAIEYFKNHHKTYNIRSF